MPRPRTLALILAGGEGSRLGPLTERRAKPAMPYAGVYRLIDFPLSHSVHSGLSDVWVIEQYRPHSLNEHLANGRPWDLDRTYGGLQILPPYTVRDKDAPEAGFAGGNADALYRNRRFLKEFDPDLLLVLSADHIYRLDYRDAIDFHLEREADVTMVTTRVAPEDASRYGVAEVNGDGWVEGFAYKPEHPRSSTVTTEVFVYTARTLLDALDELAGEGDGDGDGPPLKDFGHELIPRLVEEGRAWSYPLEGYWRDVGTVESYWRSHMDLLDGKVDMELDDPAWPILTCGGRRMPARIHASARIDNSRVSPGCEVAGRVERSVLSPGVTVEEGAVVRNSVLFGGAYVASGCTVDHAILDEGVRVEGGTLVGARKGGREDSGKAGVSPEIAVVCPGDGS